MELEGVIFNDTFVISQYKFKVKISLTTDYTSAINISKVHNLNSDTDLNDLISLGRLFQINDPLKWTELVP